MRQEALPHAVVVADAGYGVVGEFRAGLEARGERYLVGLTGEELVFSAPPRLRRAGAGPEAAPWATTDPRPPA